MGWKQLSEDAQHWAFWLTAGSGIVIAAMTGAVWVWWSYFWRLSPPIRGLGFLVVFTCGIWALYGAMRIKDRYFGAKRHGDAALSGSLSIHHARWVSTRNRDVTEEARARVQQGRLDLPVDPHELGPDPWKHQPKELVVTYSVGDGPILTISAKDYDRLQIP